MPLHVLGAGVVVPMILVRTPAVDEQLGAELEEEAGAEAKAHTRHRQFSSRPLAGRQAGCQEQPPGASGKAAERLQCSITGLPTRRSLHDGHGLPIPRLNHMKSRTSV